MIAWPISLDAILTTRMIWISQIGTKEIVSFRHKKLMDKINYKIKKLYK
jgi:hypothetical protein